MLVTFIFVIISTNTVNGNFFFFHGRSIKEDTKEDTDLASLEERPLGLLGALGRSTPYSYLF